MKGGRPGPAEVPKQCRRTCRSDVDAVPKRCRSTAEDFEDLILLSENGSTSLGVGRARPMNATRRARCKGVRGSSTGRARGRSVGMAQRGHRLDPSPAPDTDGSGTRRRVARARAAQLAKRQAPVVFATYHRETTGNTTGT